jgi:hypothetical protein
MQSCTLVLEFNCTPKGQDSGSVWLFAGDGSADLARPAPFDQLPGWSRVAGPLPYQTVHDIHAALKKFLVQSGVTVIDEGVAE